METTATSHRNSIEVAKYTVGINSFKQVNQNQRLKMRDLKVYRNGKLVYFDRFKEDDRSRHEQWADNFINAMRSRDSKQYLEQLEQMKGF